ncbi:MAG: hypothetical protein WKF73_13430 [Nocardioidaceae bacterium]
MLMACPRTRLWRCSALTDGSAQPSATGRAGIGQGHAQRTTVDWTYSDTVDAPGGHTSPGQSRDLRVTSDLSIDEVQLDPRPTTSWIATPAARSARPTHKPEQDPRYVRRREVSDPRDSVAPARLTVAGDARGASEMGAEVDSPLGVDSPLARRGDRYRTLQRRTRDAGRCVRP